MCIYVYACVCPKTATHIVCHDTELMQGGLTIEQHYVAINQVSLNHITTLQKKQMVKPSKTGERI